MIMDSKRSIDILLATYNGEKYLAEQIDSIMAQSNQDWQLLIRDDGSTDDTVSIAKDYVAQYPDRMALIEDDGCHLGASLNFQRLLENSTADYIMFSDQDDVWLDRKIQMTWDLMKSTEREYPDKPVLVHTDLTVVDAQLKTIARSTWKYQGTPPETGNDPQKVLLQNVATGCTIMINRKAKEVSMPIPKEAVMHDWWLIINVAKHGRVAHISDQLVLYRQHGSNAVGAKEAPRMPRTPRMPRLNGRLFFERLKVRKQHLFSLRTRTMNHYRMVKKSDPTATFCSVVLRKVASKIAQRFR